MKKDGIHDTGTTVESCETQMVSEQYAFDWDDVDGTDLRVADDCNDVAGTELRTADDLMIKEIREKLHGAVSKNTERAYLSDFRQFCHWCREQGHTPVPAEVAILVAYIEWMTKFYKSDTIRRRIDSLGSIFFYLKQPNATKDSEVNLAFKRMYRKLGRHQQQASPLTRPMLNRMLKVCGSSTGGLRNQVLLRLGYESLRRRSELCSFRFEDIHHYPNGAAYILLRFSKTDQLGNGRPVPISPELQALIERWRRKIRAVDGEILRSVARNGRVGTSLHPSSINRILKDVQQEAFGCRCKESLSGHSFRVGASIDLLEQGESLSMIMIRAGWRSESTAVRYLRNYAAQMGNAPLESSGSTKTRH